MNLPVVRFPPFNPNYRKTPAEASIGMLMDSKPATAWRTENGYSFLQKRCKMHSKKEQKCAQWMMRVIQ